MLVGLLLKPSTDTDGVRVEIMHNSDFSKCYMINKLTSKSAIELMFLLMLRGIVLYLLLNTLKNHTIIISYILHFHLYNYEVTTSQLIFQWRYAKLLKAKSTLKSSINDK